MKAIVVVDQNWGIGCQGKLLAHLPEDLKFFKQMTLGKVIVMGRETLESLPGGKPLPGRTNIVLTGNKLFQADCPICHSMGDALKILETYEEEDVFIVGGAQIYRQFLPCCTEIYVTKIDAAFPADKYFENLDLLQEWKLTSQSDIKEHDGLAYRFLTYTSQAEPRRDCVPGHGGGK